MRRALGAYGCRLARDGLKCLAKTKTIADAQAVPETWELVGILKTVEKLFKLKAFTLMYQTLGSTSCQRHREPILRLVPLHGQPNRIPFYDSIQNPDRNGIESNNDSIIKSKLSRLVCRELYGDGSPQSTSVASSRASSSITSSIAIPGET